MATACRHENLIIHSDRKILGNVPFRLLDVIVGMTILSWLHAEILVQMYCYLNF